MLTQGSSKVDLGDKVTAGIVLGSWGTVVALTPMFGFWPLLSYVLALAMVYVACRAMDFIAALRNPDQH